MKLNEIFNNVKKLYRNIEQYEISYEEAKSILQNNKKAILIDVRSTQEYKEGHLNGSINIPLYDIKKMFNKIELDMNNTIILYCQSGQRSKKAIKFLEKNGFKNLYEIKGGLDGM